MTQTAKKTTEQSSNPHSSQKNKAQTQVLTQMLSGAFTQHGNAAKAAQEQYKATVNTLCAITCELSSSSNVYFNQAMNIFREVAQCRTAGSVFDLQRKITQQSIDNCTQTGLMLNEHLQEHAAKSLKLLELQIGRS